MSRVSKIGYQKSADDMMAVMELFNRMKTDAQDNGVKMFDANEEMVNGSNMFSHFYKFIKRHITITKNNDDILPV